MAQVSYDLACTPTQNCPWDENPQVVEACRNHGVFRMKRGTGGFIPAAVAKASSRAALPLCNPLHRLQTPAMFRRAQLPSWRW